MSRWVIVAVCVLGALLILPLAARFARHEEPPAEPAAVRIATPLHEAAAGGQPETVQRLLKDGADANARDEAGKTPLHLAAAKGHVGTVKALLEGGADPNVVDDKGKTAFDYALDNGHGQTADSLRASTSVVRPQGLKPSLKYPDLASFEQAIAQPGCLLTSEHVYLFAPKTREREAGIVLPYLVKAYEALRRIVGVDTDYVIVVYCFPKGHPDAWGGTGDCDIWYDDTHLDLEHSEEWTRYHVPHVSGFIEEMAHNFVGATRAQFGWEMIGWTIGSEVTSMVAGNPILTRSIQGTRQGQLDTFRQYKQLGHVFPPDLPPNQVDRIHAYILWECEQQYGPTFWPDFFKEIAKDSQRLREAALAADGDAVRNKRYQITVDCFDRLPGLNFKQRLQQSGISLTTDIKSFRPTEPGWNRKLE